MSKHEFSDDAKMYTALYTMAGTLYRGKAGDGPGLKAAFEASPFGKGVNHSAYARLILKPCCPRSHQHCVHPMPSANTSSRRCIQT